VARSGLRQGTTTLAVVTPDDLPRVDALMATSGGAVLVAVWPDAPVPEGAVVVDVPLLPLGAADVRRTVVGFAPHTREAAQVAERLHRLSGGLPAILVPLLHAHTHEKAVELPESVPAPEVARRAIESLPDLPRSVVTALAVLDRSASIPLLESIVGAPVADGVAELVSLGIVSTFEGSVVLTAGAFRTVALELHPNLEGLKARVEAARLDDPTVPGATLTALCAEAERLLCRGNLRAALDTAERAAELATAVGDRMLECQARATWGLVLLETGAPRRARRCLADATAIARAVGDRDLRHRTHVLRAWAEMDERPGDPGAAAAALDRLMPLVSELPEAVDDPTGALSCTLWARAAATLRDRGAWRRAAQSAEPRVAAQQGVAEARLRLLLAEAALAIHDKSVPERIAVAQSAAAAFPLHAWWSACLESRSKKEPPPDPGGLTHLLGEADTRALKARGRQVGR
jgi:hypothetical protein